MLDPFPILPFRRPATGVVELPGSKSITNRALLLAALADGATTLTGVLFSRDTEIMLAALQELGFAPEVDLSERAIRLDGLADRSFASEATLHVGNAGTAARFLTALLALHPRGTYQLDGDPAMRARPMRALLVALGQQGAELAFKGAPQSFPFTLQSRGLAGGRVSIDASASSQFVSALLIAAPRARAPIEVRADKLRPAFVEVTLQMMAQFGVVAERREDGSLRIDNTGSYQSPGVYRIEPDVSAASYFLALPIVTGGRISLPGLKPIMLQGDALFAQIVRDLGAEVIQSETGWEVSAQRTGPGGLDRDFSTFSDTFLTLAAIAPLLGSPTTIRGIGHTRAQETDRIAAMATELKRLGCGVAEGPDWLRIDPDPAALRRAAEAGVDIETYEDHRIAMAFAILGCADLRGDGNPWLRVADPLCCRKTFPDFFEKLAELHTASHL